MVIAVTATSAGSVSGSIRSRSTTTDLSMMPLAGRCSGTEVEPRVCDRIEICPKPIGVDPRRPMEKVSHKVGTDKMLTLDGTQFANGLARSVDDETCFFASVSPSPGSAAPASVRRASSECSRGDGVRHEGDRGALCDKIFRRIQFVPYACRFPSRRLSAVVDFPAVGDSQHQDDEAVVLDRVNNSVIAHSHTPATPFATSKQRGA